MIRISILFLLFFVTACNKVDLRTVQIRLAKAPLFQVKEIILYGTSDGQPIFAKKVSIQNPVKIENTASQFFAIAFKNNSLHGESLKDVACYRENSSVASEIFLHEEDCAKVFFAAKEWSIASCRWTRKHYQSQDFQHCKGEDLSDARSVKISLVSYGVITDKIDMREKSVVSNCIGLPSDQNLMIPVQAGDKSMFVSVIDVFADENCQEFLRPYVFDRSLYHESYPPQLNKIKFDRYRVHFILYDFLNGYM